MPNEENLIPYKKGQSGNPKGRPKGSKNIKTCINEVLDQEASMNDFDDAKLKDVVRRLKEEYGKKVTKRDVMYFVLGKKAMSGDLGAISMLMDRTEGKPTQHNINENIDTSYEDYLESLKEEGEE